MTRDDELAPTAEQSAPGPAPTRPSSAGLSGLFGRYRIERELGRGGMGVVYAAFDPELERRVALKVLPNATAEDARARLQREARAMARLASPNVATVFEVGTIEGQDFVAMELLEGGTLADWLTSKRRTTREILAAFTAAGRGLADAHIAGLVHRDFKPANVLRGRDGRFAVTDFGLARESTTGPSPMRPSRVSEPVAVPPPLALDDVTQTGWVLGTPQYMAPEQWENHVVTPATDQFAFCVSLWEATCGERPFRGASGDTLLAAVKRGPRELDASGIPRELRAIVLRGLEPDPDRRWPSMDSLLAALQRAQRRPVRIAQLAGALVVAGGVAAAMAWPHTPLAACTPARDPDTIWTAANRAALQARGFEESELSVIDRDVTAWHTAWSSVCAAPAPEPDRQACLDGIVGHLAAVAHAGARATDSAAVRDTLLAQLVPIEMCQQPAVPRLLASWTPADEAELAQVAELGDHLGDAATLLPEPAATDGCARRFAAEARMRVSEGSAALPDDLDGACADDHIAAELDIMALSEEAGGAFDDAVYDQRIAHIAARYDRFADPDARGFVLFAGGQAARDADLLDEAIAKLQAARELALQRGLRVRASEAAVEALRLRFTRGPEPDHDSLAIEIRKAVADAHDLPTRTRLQALAKQLAWYAGDLAEAHADFVAQPSSGGGGHLTGSVVDARGAPVAGAEVAAGSMVMADSLGAAPWLAEHPRMAVTDAAGRFALDDIGSRGAIVAQHGTLRSRPAEIGGGDQRLVLEPTHRLTGTAHLAGPAPGHATVAISVPGMIEYRLVAPIAADGSFTVDGVPAGPLVIGVIATVDADYGWWRQLAASEAERVVLDVPAMTRSVTAIARSVTTAPLASARIVVLPGAPETLELRDARSLLRYERSADMFGARTAETTIAGARLMRDDLVILLQHLPATGALTACAFGSFDNLRDGDAYAQLAEHLEAIPVTCAAIGASDAAVVLEVAAGRRVGD